MPKSLSARIAERKSKGNQYGRNKAAFLAVRDQVKRALDDGWSMLSIWETLHTEGKFTSSYQAFRRAVLRHFSGQRLKAAWAKVSTRKENEKRRGKPDQQGTQQVNNNETTTSERGFVFNRNPKKEDLF